MNTFVFGMSYGLFFLQLNHLSAFFGGAVYAKKGGKIKNILSKIKNKKFGATNNCTSEFAHYTTVESFQPMFQNCIADSTDNIYNKQKRTKILPSILANKKQSDKK